jgi:phospholipid N-methyltransferase
VTSRLKFLSEFIRSPLQVGSPIATSRRTIKLLLARVVWSEVRLFLEYGPGTGEFTRYILTRAPADARLVAIESDEGLADHLARMSDRRLTVCKASANQTRAIVGRRAAGEVDYILTGIPFSSLDENHRDQIVRDASILLKPTGEFLVYQVRRSIEHQLHAHFFEVRRRRVWMNLPPYHLYWCAKPKAAPKS